MKILHKFLATKEGQPYGDLIWALSDDMFPVALGFVSMLENIYDPHHRKSILKTIKLLEGH